MNVEIGARGIEAPPQATNASNATILVTGKYRPLEFLLSPGHSHFRCSFSLVLAAQFVVPPWSRVVVDWMIKLVYERNGGAGTRPFLLNKLTKAMELRVGSYHIF